MGVHGEIQKVVVTSVVLRHFCILPGAPRACADFCDPTAVSRLKGRTRMRRESKWKGDNMKTSAAIMICAMMVWMTSCQFTGPSVKVEGPKVKIPGVEIGVQGGGKFCPPGQAKKGRC